MLEKINDQLDRLKKLSLKQQMLFFLITVTAFLTFIQLAVVFPLTDLTASYLSQKQQVEQQVNQLEAFAQAHPDQAAYLRDIHLQVAQINEQLPDAMDMSTFLLMLDQTAQNTGVNIINITPETHIVAQNYREIPITVQVRGKYLAILEFMDQCQNLPRFNVIKGIQVQSKSGVLECKIPISIFVFGAPPQKNTAQK